MLQVIRPGFGKLEWQLDVDLIGADLDNVSIGTNFVEVDSSRLPALNCSCMCTLDNPPNPRGTAPRVPFANENYIKKPEFGLYGTNAL